MNNPIKIVENNIYRGRENNPNPIEFQIQNK